MVVVADNPCSPKKLAFKDEVECSDSVFEDKDEVECSDSVFKDDSLELENCAQEITRNLPRKMSHSVSTGEVKLTPYKVAAFCAICFIVGCFMLPIIFYYVNNGERIDTQEVCSLVYTGVNVFVSIPYLYIYTYKYTKKIGIFNWSRDHSTSIKSAETSWSSP